MAIHTPLQAYLLHKLITLGEQSVQEPAACGLAVHPHQRIVGRAGDEITARRFLAVPPTRLDALATCEQRKRAGVMRSGADLLERPRRIEQPERPLAWRLRQLA